MMDENSIGRCMLILMPLLRRQKISYVEQTPVMLNMPVKAFLNFGIEQSQSVAETQKMLIEMLEIDGLLTKDINENGSNLSGGEKQKLSIVRAFPLKQTVPRSIL